MNKPAILYIAMGTWAVISIMLLWHIDISIGAILTGGILTNGFQYFTPMQIYHISFYASIGMVFAYMILFSMAMSMKGRIR